MLEADVLSAVIGEVYDAVLNPELWPSVLRQAAEFIGGSAAALYSKDAASKHGTVYFDDGGVTPHYRQLYFDKYIKLDPSTTAQYLAKVGEPFGTGDVMSYDEFLRSRFYREWVKPQQLVDCINAVLEKSATSIAVFGVFRHARHGVVDDKARRRMSLIVPHVRRAVLIGRVMDLQKAEAATFADTLDGIAAGMFLVEESARVVHVNAAGQALLAAGTMLRVAGDRLTAVNAQADQTLLDIFMAAGSGDAAIGSKGIAVPLSGCDSEPYVAHVLPLTSGARRRGGTAYAAVAAVFVHKAALKTPSPPEVIAKTYALTASELRVLLAIVSVGGAPETAEALGIAETTVKFHLRRLFEKTGARRQADLVKLVAGFANPLAG